MKILRYSAVLLMALAFLVPAGRTIAQSSTGAAVIDLGSPAVTADGVSIVGSVRSGTVGCTSGTGGGIGPICNCCQPVLGKDTGNWRTCPIGTVSYSISGPASKSGSVEVTSDTTSPASCTLQCSPVGSPDRCTQNKGFSVNETSLPPGAYSLTVTSNDCKGINTASQSFTVPTPLTGSCAVTPQAADKGQSVVWSGSASGGTGSYSYSWTGTDGLSGSNKSVTKAYTTAGSKTGTLKITSGTNTLTKSCQVTVRETPTVALAATCSGSPNPAEINTPVTWKVDPTGGTGEYAYAWTGVTSGATTRTGTVTYTTSGNKTASVRVTSGSEVVNATCSVVEVLAGPAAQTKGTVGVVSNKPTTWTISGPESISQSAATTSASYPNKNTGTYTISPAAIPGYTLIPSPIPSQTLSGNGNSILFSLQYVSVTTTPTTTPTSTPENIPNVDIRANGAQLASITAGQAVKLTWTSSYVSNCFATAGPWNGSRPINNTNPGEQSGALATRTTYTITCYGAQEVSDSVTVNVTGSPSGQAPTGYHDYYTSNTCMVYGWAADPDDRAADLKVRLYADGAFVKEITANKYRSDLEAAGVCTGGTCAVSESLSGLIIKDVPHAIRMTAIDAQNGTEHDLPNTPKTITCSTPTTGSISVTSNLPTKWTLTGPDGSMQQTASSTASTSGSVRAGIYTISGIPAISGYKTPIVSPAVSQTLTGGNSISYTIRYDIDPDAQPSPGGLLTCAPEMQSVTEGQAATLTAAGGTGATYTWTADAAVPSGQTGSSAQFTTAWGGEGLHQVLVGRGSDVASCYVNVSDVGNDVPEGVHQGNDNASCLVSGWSVDPDDRSLDVVLRVYVDNVLFRSVTANRYDAALEPICPGGTCSFVQSLAGITTGVNHAIKVMAVDSQTGEEVALDATPQTIRCASAGEDYAVRASTNLEIDLTKGVQSNATTITIDPLNGFGSTVTLAARSSSPELSSAIYTIADNALDSSQYGSGSTLQVRVDASTPTGSYPITVEGVGGGKIRSANVTLKIIGKRPSFIEI